MDSAERTHLVFDIDDTLTQTRDYLQQAILDYFVKRDDWKAIEKLAANADRNLWDLPLSHRDVIEKILEEEVYLTEVKPTRLFNHYFCTPGNVDQHTKVSLCSMRGWTPNGMAKTKLWLKKHRACIDIHDIHLLDPRKTPSKIDYLSNVYGNNFLLVDDNPFYHVSTKVYKKDERIAVYEECEAYPCNSSQNKLLYDNGTYKINGKPLR